jgi:hypothetical protein
LPFILVPGMRTVCVDIVVKVGIDNVQFEWADPDDRT